MPQKQKVLDPADAAVQVGIALAQIVMVLQKLPTFNSYVPVRGNLNAAVTSLKDAMTQMVDRIYI